MIDNLREATLDDVEDITRIYNDAVKSRIATADTEPISVKQKRDEFIQCNMSKYPLWVREYKGKIIAFLCFKPFNERKGYQQTAEVSIYLDKNFQGQKLGQQFLDEAINKAPDFGYENLLAFIFSDNAPSIKLFKKFGFREWGKFPKVAKIDGENKDLLILGRSLE